MATTQVRAAIQGVMICSKIEPLSQHYVWAAGHFVLLLATFRYFLAAVTFNAYRYSFYYKRTHIYH